MANDLEPVRNQDPITQSFIEKFNLPEMIAGPAGKAISRLIAGVVDIPVAYLESFAQSIKDKSAARTKVSNEVATAAAKIAAADNDIVGRAAHNLLAKEYRRQKNKEDIARRTIELLQEEPGPDGSTTKEDVSEDWLNVFEKYAEDASSEHMQELWAKLLAGEIRKPGAFSLRTLQFVSTADPVIAQAFQDAAGFITLDFVPTVGNLSKTIGFNKLLLLDEAGLLGTVGGLLTRNVNMEGVASFGIVFGRTRAVVVNRTLTIEGIPLTRIGKELLAIIDFEPSEAAIQAVAKCAYDQGDTDVKIADIRISGDQIVVLREQSFSPPPKPEGQK